ncbi:MAG: hypothetical protein VW879_15895, partial [Opitutae bacterium]
RFCSLSLQISSSLTVSIGKVSMDKKLHVLKDLTNKKPRLLLESRSFDTDFTSQLRFALCKASGLFGR